MMNPMETALGALQCHFTWDLEPGASKLFRLRDKLLDIGTEEGNVWLGHIYNLRGFIQYKLGLTEDALSLFTEAVEAFRKVREAEEGPWLLVNYGNLAWLHHHLGDQEQSQACLSKVNDLKKKYPPPDQEQLHAEVCAEKAWTLMKFSKDKKLLAKGYFETALKMQPEMMEWYSSYVILLMDDVKYDHIEEDEEILKKMQIANEQDPENMYLAVHYLDQRARRLAKKGEPIDKEEACELGRKVLSNPVSSYSGLSALLWVYKKYISVDEAIALAEDALEKHPHVRYVKRAAALLYKWISTRDKNPDQGMVERAISIHEELISLYPDSSLMKRIDLANIYAKKTGGLAQADRMYQELLTMDLNAADQQMLYHWYANHSYHVKRDIQTSQEYNLKAAKIPQQAYFRERSINLLVIVRDNGKSPMCAEINEFLENLENTKCM